MRDTRTTAAEIVSADASIRRLHRSVLFPAFRVCLENAVCCPVAGSRSAFRSRDGLAVIPGAAACERPRFGFEPPRVSLIVFDCLSRETLKDNGDCLCLSAPLKGGSWGCRSTMRLARPSNRLRDDGGSRHKIASTTETCWARRSEDCCSACHSLAHDTRFLAAITRSYLPRAQRPWPSPAARWYTGRDGRAELEGCLRCGLEA